MGSDTVPRIALEVQVSTLFEKKVIYEIQNPRMSGMDAHRIQPTRQTSI